MIICQSRKVQSEFSFRMEQFPHSVKLQLYKTSVVFFPQPFALWVPVQDDATDQYILHLKYIWSVYSLKPVSQHQLISKDMFWHIWNMLTNYIFHIGLFYCELLRPITLYRIVYSYTRCRFLCTEQLCGIFIALLNYFWNEPKLHLPFDTLVF